MANPPEQRAGVQIGAPTVMIAAWILIVTAGTAPGLGGPIAAYIRTMADAGACATLMAVVAFAVAIGSLDPSIPQQPWMKDVVVVGAGLGQAVAVALPPWVCIFVHRWWQRRRETSPVVFTGAIRATWAAMWEHVPRYLGLVFLTFVGMRAAESTVDALTLPSRPLAWTLALAAWTIHVVVGATLLRLCLAIVDGRTPTLRESVPGPSTLLRFGALCELWTAGTMLGISVLLVPGIIWAVAFSFAGLLLVEQRVGFFYALRRSARLTRGLRWRLFKLGSLWLPTSVLFGVLRQLTPQHEHALPVAELVHAFILPALTLLLCIAYRRVNAEAVLTDPPRRPAWWWLTPDTALASGWTLAASVPVLWSALQRVVFRH